MAVKKKISVVILAAIILLSVGAWAELASTKTTAQASNVQVLFFYSPICSVCQQVKPLVESAAAQTGAKLIEYDMSTYEGGRMAQKYNVTEAPTIVILDAKGAISAKLRGADVGIEARIAQRQVRNASAT